MNNYEMMFIVKATMAAEEVKATAEAIKKIVTDEKGKVVEFKELGEKKLAYSIKHEISGYYYVMTFEASKETQAEINRKANLDENILRHLIIKLDEE
ncbi:MAG: 30S ribosomal protein S6 [Candidatus Coprovivens sp.]